MRVAKIDVQADLALVVVEDGPWPASCPVAPRGHMLGTRLLAVGYAQMKWPAKELPSSRTLTGGLRPDRTYTREPPTPGMSGGPLLDLDHQNVVGICSAVDSLGRGVYVSHAAILEFLKVRVEESPEPPGAPKGPIRIEQAGGSSGPPNCPDGRCPQQGPAYWQRILRLKEQP